MMEIPESYEQAVPVHFLKQIRKQLDMMSDLAANLNLVLGGANSHAKRLAVIKFELESLYAAMAKSRTAVAENDEDEGDDAPDDVDVTTISRARKIGVKSSARLNTHQLDNINYYIRHLQSEQDIYLLYEFFDLIVAKVKEYGAYNAEQIWEGIKSEVALMNNKASARNMRDILDNHELQEGLSLYVAMLREKQERKAE